jgi:hypothetical protein
MPGMRASSEVMEKAGSPWVFGTDNPEALFAEYGWDAETTEPSEYGRQLGRWPYPAAPPRLSFLLECVRR